MHGGTNRGAPRGNNNSRKHGNRSAEAEAQLKIVRRANLGPVDKGDSQKGQYLIQGRFWGGYLDPGFDERRGMGLP